MKAIKKINLALPLVITCVILVIINYLVRVSDVGDKYSTGLIIDYIKTNGLINSVIWFLVIYFVITIIVLTVKKNSTEEKHKLSDSQEDFGKENAVKQESLSLEDKADELADSVRVLVSIIEGKLRRQYPSYFSVIDSTRFIYFNTIATFWLVCVRLHLEVDKEYRTPLELRARKTLYEWQPDMEKELENIQQHVSERVLLEQERKKRGELLEKSAFLWAIQRITGRISSKADITLANALQDVISTVTQGYWKR